MGESSSEAHRGHVIAEATFTVSLVISECLLLAISVYLLLLGNDLNRIIAALLLVAFFVIAVIIYKNATAEEKEEEQYAVSSKTEKRAP